LSTAAAGAVLLVSAREVAAKGRGTPSGPSSPARASARSSLYVCDVCGHVELGSAPEFCPVCHAEERFSSVDADSIDSEVSRAGL